MGDPSIKLYQFIIGADFNNLSRPEATGLLCENFIRCTRKEAEWLAQNQQLHPYFKDVMVVLFEIVKKTDIANSLNCVRFCMQIYIKIVLDCIAPCATTPADKLDLINQQFRVFTSMQSVRIYDELFMNAYTMILSLVERFNDDIKTSLAEIKAGISALTDCEAKTILLTRFETIVE